MKKAVLLMITLIPSVGHIEQKLGTKVSAGKTEQDSGVCLDFSVGGRSLKWLKEESA